MKVGTKNFHFNQKINMKKLILIFICFPFFIFSQNKNCLEGNCINGKGTIHHSDGSKYFGKFKNGLFHGKGILIRSDSSVYTGTFKNGLPNGKGNFIYSDSTTYKGKFLNGKHHGFGKLSKNLINSLTYYEGQWEDGQRNGNGICRYSDGYYDGEWKDDLRNGAGKYVFFKDGSYYVGFWENDLRHGKGYSENYNVSIYDGQWKNGVRSGYGTFKIKNLGTYFGNWKNNYMNGRGKMIYIDGTIEETNYYNGFNVFSENYLRDSLYSIRDLPFNFDVETVRFFLDKKKYLENNEGIYKYYSNSSIEYKFLIKKHGQMYFGYLLDGKCQGCGNWNKGDIKFEMIETAVKNIFDVIWKNSNKTKSQEIFYNQLNGGVLTNNSTFKLVKLYPKLNKSIKNGEWAVNGSGVIISKSGHIITNNHVIDDADDIEVEFILDNEVQKFNAEIIQVDKTNDLAIIKIVDVNFDGIDSPPYNFKTRSSDVGTKVYAFGYPMALSIMGKEIKVTDGIISSKTGYDGDITTYQISAPIQGGNSGGPLFDDKGNFIGINSSGINKKLADNVGYSIKTSYVLNLIDILPKSIDLPSNKKLANLPLTEQIKEISKYVVLVKVK